jgi:hypothetical protein
MKWPCVMLRSLVLGSNHEEVAANLQKEVRSAVHDIRNKAFAAVASSERSVAVSERAIRTSTLAQATAANAIERIEKERDE